MPKSRGALSPLWRFCGFLVLAIVILGSIGIGRSLAPGAVSGPTIISGAIPRVVLAVLGLIVMLAAVGLYGLILLTNCFTLNFSRSFIRAYGRKLWPCDVMVKLLASTGFTFMTGPTLASLLSQILPIEVAQPVGYFGSFICSQIFLVWFQMWAPLDRRLIVRRMRAIGVPPERIATGLVTGTTGLDFGPRKWFRIVDEDDLGMLWFDQDRLVFLGDACAWSITRDQLSGIERAAMKSATSAYFGAVHVILVFRRDDGSSGAIRLHAPGRWTQTAKARALDDLADRIESWMSAALALPPAIGFAAVAPQ
jgi:hypothetical protein